MERVQEFAFALEYLGVPASDYEQERLFHKYDEDKTGESQQRLHVARLCVPHTHTRRYI